MRVELFITCLVDTLFPSIGRATVKLLERSGAEVRFRSEQTCCGQMHYNAGYHEEARCLAQRFGRVFGPGDGPIVTPSASCAGHVRSIVPRLAPAAAPAAGRVVELTELLVDWLEVSAVRSEFVGRIAWHPTCHSLRVLRVGDRPERLLRSVAGVELVELPQAETCCGFGGLFAVKNHLVSSAMLDAKLDAIAVSTAGFVSACDASCLMHIGGGLSSAGSAVQAVHLAEVLAA